MEVEDESGHQGLSPGKRDWVVQPGLLWYQAPWVAIELVSKNPYNVDWAMKPPFASFYDEQDCLKEGVFPRRWSYVMTTRPERNAQRVKRLSRDARKRAEESAEELRSSELEARLIWNLREIRPKPPSPEEPTIWDVSGEPNYDDDADLERSRSTSLWTPMAPNWNTNTQQSLFAAPNTSHSPQYGDWEMLQNVNPTTTVAPGTTSFVRYAAQDHRPHLGVDDY